MDDRTIRVWGLVFGKEEWREVCEKACDGTGKELDQELFEYMWENFFDQPSVH